MYVAPLKQVAAYLRGCVVASVVYDDDFEVAVGLFAQRRHELIDLIPFVLAWGEDGDERILEIELVFGLGFHTAALVECRAVPDGH